MVQDPANGEDRPEFGRPAANAGPGVRRRTRQTSKPVPFTDRPPNQCPVRNIDFFGQEDDLNDEECDEKTEFGMTRRIPFGRGTRPLY